MLFSDGRTLGVRSDYNGVLLLDTILQKITENARDEVKLELLLSEALTLKQCFTNVNTPSMERVVQELETHITEAQTSQRKGIKAQKWNTVCLRLPLEILRSCVSNVMTELVMRNQHSPEVGVVSAVQDRLFELSGDPVLGTDRGAMASEAKRRDTFSRWPHMDYK